VDSYIERNSDGDMNSHRLRYFTREVSAFDVGPVNPTITVVFILSAVQILRPVINSGSYSTVKYRRGNALMVIY
jgi:hypothetical protein